MTRRRSAVNFGGVAAVFDSPARTRCGVVSPGQRVEPDRAPVRRAILADCRGTGLGRLGLPDHRRLPRRRPGAGINGLFSPIPYFRTHISKQPIAMPFVVATRLALVLSMSPGLAQMFQYPIAGLRADESKAVVAGANVTLTNLGVACLAMLGTTDKEKL